MFGNLGEVRVIQEFAMVSILVAVVWTILGTVVIRALSFPLLFLFFAVPFGTSLIRPLQDFTAWFVIHALTISNVPSVLENHIISLPSGVWTVAEACSGIRFLFSSVVFGTFFSFLVYQSRARRAIFVCASIIVPIVGNALRAYLTILLAYMTNNRVAVGVDHIVYGGLFSVFIQFVLMIIGLRWRQRPETIRQIALNQAVNTSTSDDARYRTAAFLSTIAASTLIIATPLIAGHLWNKAAIATTMHGWPAPPVLVTAPWQVTAADADTSWAPEWRDPDRKFSQSYQYESHRVDLYWVFYSGQHEIEFPAHSDGTVDTKPWTLASDGFRSAMLGSERIRIYRTLVESQTTARAVWIWYCVAGEYTANRERVKLLQTKARFLGKPAAVAMISLGTDNLTNEADAEHTLQDFLLHFSVSTTSSLAVPGSSLSHEFSGVPAVPKG
jgi:EpsI family protein